MLKNKKALKESIEALKNPSFNQKKKLKFGQKQTVATVEDIREKWKKIIKKNQKSIENLYNDGVIEDWVECRTKMENDFSFEDEIYTLLINWLEKINWTDLEDVRVLFYYIEILSNSNYGLNGEVLLKHHKKLQEQIKKLILKQDFEIISSYDGETGNLGELVENLVHLYFFHTKHSWGTIEDISQYDLDRRDMANLLPEVIKAFPKNSSNLFFSILEDHQEPQKAYADLVEFYMRNSIDCFDLASDLFSMYNGTSDFFHKNAPNIIKIVVQENDFSDKDIDYLIDNILLSQLNLASKEKQIEDLKAHISKLKHKGKFPSMTIKYEKDLAKLIQNWDSINKKNWNKAVRRIAVSRPTFKSAELIAKTFPKHPKSSILNTLLAEAEEFKNKPKLYNLNTKPKTIFKDFHFKLLVIEELMYEQKILLPIFGLDRFLEEYTKREIEKYNCELIPEVKKYFKNIDIPMELLTKVTTLYQDSGLNGGSEFINQMFPDWDPGAGDEVFKITNKAIADLELLPNLKKIIGIENSEPSRKLLKAFEAKGIVLETEE